METSPHQGGKLCLCVHPAHAPIASAARPFGVPPANRPRTRQGMSTSAEYMCCEPLPRAKINLSIEEANSEKNPAPVAPGKLGRSRGVRHGKKLSPKKRSQ